MHARGQAMSLDVTATVFIVDDDAAVRSAVSLLVKSCGWRPLACASAEELFEAVAGQWPACVLLDLHMSDMDGVSVQRELARRGVDVPVVYISAYSDHPLVTRAVRNGACQVVSKPFQTDDLVEAISRAIKPPT